MKKAEKFPPFFMGEAFLPTVEAFLLTVKLLGLQSLKALIRRTFPFVSKKLQLQVKKAKAVSKNSSNCK